MRRKFSSIENGHYGYAYDTDAWTSSAPVHPYFRMFETYGDGVCQHSGDWPITNEFFGDYLLSMAQAMLNDAELAGEMGYRLESRRSLKDVEFAAGIVFKPSDRYDQVENKPRYFGDEDWKEELITEVEDRIEAASEWARQNGFDRLRVATIAL